MRTPRPTITKTEITYEEWWAAEKKRLLNGCQPTTRVIVRHCLKCKINVGEYGHVCSDWQAYDNMFDVCDRVMLRR